MRLMLSMVLLLALVFSGCAKGKAARAPAGAAPAHPPKKQGVIVAPDTAVTGKVTRVHAEGRFVVLTFPVGHLPSVGQGLSVFRRGIKVGEVKVAGPQREENIVADVLTGDCQVGDEVRSQ
jgi:hypothetical protein